MELILSTSNIMDAGSSNFRPGSRSNAELIESLRSNFKTHDTSEEPADPNDLSAPAKTHADYRSWTAQKENVLEVPRLYPENSGLSEEREEYDITLKLFFLPRSQPNAHEKQARQALELVCQALKVSNVNLLILSLPGVYFDEGDDTPEKIETRGPIEAPADTVENQLETWKVIENLHDEGLIEKLGIAEFGHERLSSFLSQVRIRPSVDQINLRDCCSVPKDLLAVARKNNIDLLVHNDSSNILPKGSVRDLLGNTPNGAGILADMARAGDKRKSLHGETITNGTDPTLLEGEIYPQWVVKYTAVVKSRGVVENKGYFAMAELIP